MKKLLLSAAGVFAAAAVVVGAGGAASNHYQDHKNKQHQAQVNAVEQAKRNQYNTDKQLLDQLSARYTSVTAECQKGEAAYAKLSTLAKNSTPAPKCAAPAAQ